MNWIPNIFRRRKLYNDLSEEIRLHIEERADQLMGEGMGPAEAQRQARLAFGNTTVLEERSREVWQWPTLESIWGDVQFALRQLRRSPRRSRLGPRRAALLRPRGLAHERAGAHCRRGGSWPKRKPRSVPIRVASAQ